MIKLKVVAQYKVEDYDTWKRAYDASAALRDDAGLPARDLRIGPFCFFWNITGQPAISLPLAQDSAGLPIGVQLVGRPADEATLLRVSAQLEVAMPWAQRRPALTL